MFKTAIVRKPGPDFAQGLSEAGLGSPDFELALTQHAAYCQALADAGLELIELDALPGFPDACFVEDTAVVCERFTLLANPGAPSRNGEKDAMAGVLEPLAVGGVLHRVEPPGTLDGGDVLQAGETFYIGLSARTNRIGAEQLAHVAREHGYKAHIVAVENGLHLKSFVNYVGGAAMLMTEPFAGLSPFKDYDRLMVPAEEAYAANSLLINDRLLIPAGFPRVRQALQSLDLEQVLLEVSEFRKMDGGLSCLSLRLP